MKYTTTTITTTPPTLVIGHRPSLSLASTGRAAPRLARSPVTDCRAPRRGAPRRGAPRRCCRLRGRFTKTPKLKEGCGGGGVDGDDDEGAAVAGDYNKEKKSV